MVKFPFLIRCSISIRFSCFGSISRRIKMFGIATPMAIQMMMNEARIPLFIATVTSPTTPCILMMANSARYISTPGIIGITLGMLKQWCGVWCQ